MVRGGGSVCAFLCCGETGLSSGGGNNRVETEDRVMEEAVRLILSLLATLMTVSVTRSQTEIGGVYSQRTRWDRARSPYLATSDVIITETGQVEVEPGVVVRFRPGVGVTVRGGRFVAEVSRLEDVTDFGGCQEWFTTLA